MTSSEEFSLFLTKEEHHHLLQELDIDIDGQIVKNETFDETLKMDLPPVVSSVLSNEEYPGPFDFEVSICPNGSKNPWVYSPSLNKIYMNMSTPFPVDFKINSHPAINLFIRTTPIFSLPQHSQDFVYRCICHAHQADPTNRGIAEDVRQHVIRCNNVQATYMGNYQNKDRLSVVFPLSVPQRGTDSVREMFVFVCKNSCATPGMNRRPIEVIFTLEDMYGEVLGRRVLMVRICSCPKRDKEKEEGEKTETAEPRGKKRKMEKKTNQTSQQNNDNKEYTLTLPIVGKNNAQQVIKYCQDLMSGEIIRHAPTGSDLPFKNCLNNLNTIANKPLD